MPMRNMSFALTTPQMRARTKTVTRRMGWADLRAGALVMAVEKGMGLKRGETVQRIGPIEILDVRREPLNAITPEDVIAEGFPDRSPDWFVAMFCEHNKCSPDQAITRIAFRHTPEWFGAMYQPPATGPKLGDWLTVRTVLRRRQRAAGREYTQKAWEAEPITPRRGMYIGWRTIRDGLTADEDGSIVFIPKSHRKAALVVFNEHSRPVLMPWEDLPQ